MRLTDVKYKPRTAEVAVVFDDDLRAAVDDLQKAVIARKAHEADPLNEPGLGDSTLSDLERRLAEARAAEAEAAVTFKFVALPRALLDAMLAEHPPSKDQLARWRQRAKDAPLTAGEPPQFDLSRVLPRLVAAAMTEPSTTTAEVLAIWDDEKTGWSDGIWAELWETAWGVQRRATVRPTSGTGTN